MTTDSNQQPEKIPFMLRHTSLITGLAIGLALAASFSFMNKGHSVPGDSPAPSALVEPGDVPSLSDIPTLDEPNTSDVPTL